MFRNKFLSYNDPSSLILRAVENDYEVFYYFSGEKYENKVKLNWLNSYEEEEDIDCILMFGFGSVNGTLCLHEFVDEGKIVLWNPVTRSINFIPPSKADLVESFIPAYAKGYVNVCVRSYLHGFGYDHVRNDYKVIQYVYICMESSGRYNGDLGDWMGKIDFGPLWEIYSLRSNSWRKLHVDMPNSLKCTEGTQVYVDGVCNWLCEDYKTVGPCLVSFYLSNEAFLVTPIPSDVDDWFGVKASWINLEVFNGSVALISYYKEMTVFHISILGEFGAKESWTTLFIVGPLPCVERPIGVGTKGELFFVRKDNELVWLDLSTQMITELGYKGAGRSGRIIIYKESILPIGGISN
jgi:F-box interacting protein